MQRFQVIGESRLQVLEGVAHVPSHARQAVAALDQLKPSLVRLDLSPAEWDMACRGFELGRFESLALPLLEKHGACEPYVLQRAAAQWAARNAAAVDLIAPLLPEEPGRRPAKALAKMLRKEGFDARDPAAAIDRLHLHYVSRVPELAEWVKARHAETANALVQRHKERRLDAVLVLSRPNADPVLDLVNVQLGRRAPDAPPRTGIPGPTWGP